MNYCPPLLKKLIWQYIIIRASFASGPYCVRLQFLTSPKLP